ncbi:MAG TPA: hypothetical protein VLF89_05440 [Candidatus Saccharimonadales bacterium]|nr:hypothetical protein [Candidatus Saccharimonadales bacterium]
MFSFPFWIIILVSAAITAKKFFSPSGLNKKVLLSNEISPKTPTKYKGAYSFIAMRYYALMLNRTFRILITDTYVCGIRVMGSIASPITVDSHWQNPEFYVDKNLEDKYKNKDFDSKEYLLVDKANFCILREDILRVDYYQTKFGMGQIPYSGRIAIVTKNGKKIELILLGSQDVKSITKHILKN